MTMEDTLKFEKSVWQKVTPICKNLIAEFLRKSPSLRITLNEAVKH